MSKTLKKDQNNSSISHNYDESTIVEDFDLQPGIMNKFPGNSAAKFIGHFDKKYIQKYNSNTLNTKGEIINSSTTKAKKRSSSACIYSNLAENARPRALPESVVAKKSRRGSRSRFKRNKPSQSPVVRRNMMFTGIESDHKHEKKMEFLNQKLRESIETVISQAKKMMLFLKTKNKIVLEFVDHMRRFQISITTSVRLLTLYRQILGVSINFGEGSRMFKILRNGLRSVGCILELLVLNQKDSTPFLNLWREASKAYCTLLVGLSKIISFKKIVKKSCQIKITNLKLAYHQSRQKSNKTPKNNKVYHNDILSTLVQIQQVLDLQIEKKQFYPKKSSRGLSPSQRMAQNKGFSLNNSKMRLRANRYESNGHLQKRRDQQLSRQSFTRLQGYQSIKALGRVNKSSNFVQ